MRLADYRRADVARTCLSVGHILGLHWNDVCAPWRIVTPLTRLGRLGYDVRFGSIEQERELDRDTALLVMHSPGNGASVRLAKQAQAAGVPVIADFDDAFFRFDKSSAASLEDSDVVAQFAEFLGQVDVVTVSTQLLASMYQRFNSNVHVLPNCYDETHAGWSLSPEVRDVVQVGFAGSGSHYANLRLVVDSLQTVMRAHSQVRVVEAGGPNLLPQLDAASERLVYLGWQPFDGFPLLLHQMDIVLAPLEDVPFNYGKSNVRCMTAGLVGAPVIASPVGAYVDYVEHGLNGFHAASEGAWTDALDRLVSDSELRITMGGANRKRSEEYAIGAHLWRWKQIYDALLYPA